VIFPKVGPSESSEIFLWNKLVEAFGKKRQSGQIKEEDRKVYWERLVYEYDTLKKKNFCDYILVVDDLIRHVKGIGGLVVCRGSAGGSLMLWVLDASCTDPIFHNLSFERFYDENRPDPPDVDIDFEQGFRNQALDYIFNTYGHNNCALIATLSKLQAKAALVDTAFAYGIPRSEFETLSRALDSKDPDTERNLAQISDPEALKVLEKYPQLRIFDQIVGQYRQSSIHAAGVLVSSMPLSESVGVILSKGRDRNIATIDKYGAADLGYLKIDALIVEGLDSIAMACRKIWGTVDPLYTMALDDQKVLRMAGDCKLAGVFQLEGASAARTVREIGIENFEDLVAASALCRPGPSNFIPIYKKNKAQLDSFETSLQGFHPVAADIIRPTYGVILYQEQVMAFARDLALFSHADVAKLRKGVSSSSGDALQQWKEKFVAGCVSNGVSPLESEHWWSTVATHGFYSFNRSHALTYAVIGYWTLYLKTYYPAEFYEAQLARQDDTITRKRLLREFQREGAIIHLLHPEHSRAHTRAIGNEIYGGFSDLFGVGETVAKAIENRAPFEDYASMLDALPARVKDAVLKTWNGTEWNVPALIKLAPWFPVPQDRVRRHGVSPAVLPDTSFSDSVTLEGWVIDTDYSKDKTIVFVEDAFGFACCRVAAKKTKSHGGFVRQIEVGDYVAVQGWWSGDTLYIQDFAIIEKGS
jgi:DNA polymerase-3 subunit alpha